MAIQSLGPTRSPLSFRRPCKKGYPARGGGAGIRRTFVAQLVLAVLAFALVSSVGAGVALHQAGFGQTLVAPNNGGDIGYLHYQTNVENDNRLWNKTGRDHDRTGKKNTAE